ncbi:agarase [Wenyingzhuangia heitensis]|uniref:Agarase n=1 Tax=Wenyingzhuangia heitensis TaxID=1487859 RepID=A0ABX0U7X1_9FLAO|nr:agarase [Wenyingzhuangia heitensis]NIJ44944.1 agarase [Wenyingzhuangia heitensis]
MIQKKIKKNLFLLGMLFVAGTSCFAQYGDAPETKINVTLNTNHVVNGIDSFDRTKYITLHADLKGSDWQGDNVIPDVRADFLEKYDVYLGRESGGLTGALKSAAEDANRPGYVDLAKLRESGEKNRKHYSWKKKKYGFEHLEYRTKNMMVVSQFHPLWPNGYKNKLGWTLSDEDTKEHPFGTASAEFVAAYMKNFFGEEGEPRPKYMEVINEPLWDLLKERGTPDMEFERATTTQMAEFHNVVAKKVKEINPDVKVGGFATAFPHFEKFDFKRWDYRWKNFIDVTGNNLDFWSIHIYDNPNHLRKDGTVYQRWRKGSSVEATLDLLQQYSMIKLNKVMPLAITEYTVQVGHHLKFAPWSRYRDWLYVKSVNSLLMSFMDQPQNIELALPFFMLKCEWGRDKKGNPYRSRLLRQQFEAEGETGDKWVYTDLVKFYQLWSDVKGKRLDIATDNIDIQTDAYVDKNKVYVIANNLLQVENMLDINLEGTKKNKLISIKKKHYHAPDGKVGVIDEEVYTENKKVTIDKEGTVILEYTFKKKVKLTHISKESKHYSEEYLQPIVSHQKATFNINEVVVSKESKAVLRVSLARDHGQNLHPKVLVNGTEINVLENYRGEPQTHRDRFFGVIEIPVATQLLQKNNKVEVLFQDNGGHVVSVTLRAFNRSKK